MAYLLNRKCCATYCNSSGKDGKTKLFSFPLGNTENQRRRYRIWAEVAGKPDMSGKAYLCHKHFEDVHFWNASRNRLRIGAIPSRNAWNSSSESAITPPSETHNLPTPSPKSFCPVQLFPPILDANSCSESNSDTLATPFDCNDSLSEHVIADVAINTTPVTTCKAKRKHRSLVLSKINVSRTSELTPRKKFLHDRLKSKMEALAKLKKKYKKKTLTLKRLENGMKGNRHKIVQELSKSMSLQAANLLASQVGRSQQVPKGHRWSLSEKLLALSIYKRSPKCYTLLRSIFALPCKSTLINLLNHVPLCTGINSQIFEALKRSVSQFEAKDRVCVLMFDEMSIREHIQYDPRSDRILGFEDLGGCGQSSDRVANHALVFMAKGLRHKWKQPVGYYFSRGGVTGKNLSTILKEVLRACRDVGMLVVATVCDMGSNNVSALKELGASFEKPLFTFENQEVVTIYDPPHLLKCIRNMFYKHDVQLNVNIGEEEPHDMIASWAHIRQAVMLDRKQVYQGLHKITNQHLDPDSFKKMKVSLAAQVLSNSMAVMLHGMVTGGKMPATAMATVKLVSTVNQIFDSLNGSSPSSQGPGGLRCQLAKTNEQLHLNFWDNAIDYVNSWHFLKQSPAQVTGTNLQYSTPQVLRPPSQDGWLATMRGVKHLWNSLKKLGFRYLKTRSLNQDPLEHLFGCIRANCGSNHNPTVGQFQAALKTSIVNGLAFRELEGTNCEMEHDGSEVLSNLHDFLVAEPDPSDGQEPCPVIQEDPPCHDLLVEEVTSYSVAYVAGYIARRLLKNNTCNNCIACLTTDTVEPFHSGISLREHFTDNRLSYPTLELCKAVGNGATLLEEKLPEVAHLPGVWKCVAAVIKENVDFSWIMEKCVDHHVSLINGIVQGICAISIPWWCRRYCRKLKDERSCKLKKMRVWAHS